MSDLNPATTSLACGLAAEVIRRFGAVRLRVTGCSMLPLVGPGDVLVVHRRTAPDFAPGEIAVFTRHHRLFAHRVVGKISTGGECRLLTRGDTLPENDPPVTSGELLGLVTAIERGLQRLHPHAPAGWTLLLARFGRRSNVALWAMAQWHGLRRHAQHRLLRIFPGIDATPQGDGVIPELST
jgi:signal peptidase I